MYLFPSRTTPVVRSNKGPDYNAPIPRMLEKDDKYFKTQDTPSLLESMGGRQSEQIYGGPEISVTLSKSGHLYSWGTGQNGRLGHGSESDEIKPRRIAAFGDNRVTHVSVSSHSVAVLDEDAAKVYTWGSGEGYQIGNGKKKDQWSPVHITLIPGEMNALKVLSVACGSAHTAVIVERPGEANELYVWGDNTSGQLGMNSIIPAKKPTLVDGSTMVKKGSPLTEVESPVQVACGGYHTVVVTESGAMFSAGLNNSGQLGHGDTARRVNFTHISSPSYDKDHDLHGEEVCMVKVHCGWGHNLSVDENGFVWTWGAGTEGQLGHQNSNPKYAPCMVKGELSTHFIVAACCGASHSMAIDEDGKLFAWGRGKNGQTGHGGTENHYTPQQVTDIDDRHMVACGAGWSHSMSITNKHDVFVWGSQAKGQLGHGDISSEARAPAPVTVGRCKVMEVACGANHTIYRTDKKHVFAMGSGANGRLGTGNFSNQTLPTPVQDLMGKNIVQMACGSAHSGVVLETGDIFMWGCGQDGRLGTGDKLWDHASPRIVDYPSKKFTQIALGSKHTVGLTIDGQIYSCGDGYWGQLGHQNCKSMFTLTRVEQLVSKHAVKISCGATYSVAVDDRNNIFVWGMSLDDPMWIPSTRWAVFGEAKRAIPRQIDSPPVEVKSLYCGGASILMMCDDGELYTYSQGIGGDLSRLDKSSWGGEPVKKMALGFNHVAILTHAGKVWTWGWGEFGQLGHGDARNSADPNQIQSLSKTVVTDLYAGFSHTALTTARGELLTWGKGDFGQLGRMVGSKKEIKEKKKVVISKKTKRYKIHQALKRWQSEKNTKPDDEDEEVVTPRDYRLPTIERATRLGFIKQPEEWVKKDVDQAVRAVVSPIIASNMLEYLGILDDQRLSGSSEVRGGVLSSKQEESLKKVREIKAKIDTGSKKTIQRKSSVQIDPRFKAVNLADKTPLRHEKDLVEVLQTRRRLNKSSRVIVSCSEGSQVPERFQRHVDKQLTPSLFPDEDENVIEGTIEWFEAYGMEQGSVDLSVGSTEPLPKGAGVKRHTSTNLKSEKGRRSGHEDGLMHEPSVASLKPEKSRKSMNDDLGKETVGMTMNVKEVTPIPKRPDRLVTLSREDKAHRSSHHGGRLSIQSSVHGLRVSTPHRLPPISMEHSWELKEQLDRSTYDVDEFSLAMVLGVVERAIIFSETRLATSGVV